MPSLTPSHRQSEATTAALFDGIFSGCMTIGPSSLAVWAAMKNPTFLKSTNWQSRTAMVIMPALFMFAFSSEQKLNHKMREMANEYEHSKEVTQWAENNRKQNLTQTSSISSKSEDTEKQLLALYKKSVADSGVRIVSGDNLGFHHKIANFWQENPFKLLAAMGVPTVLYIFHGKSNQRHLQLQSKLMHTRVYGQFAVISMLLTLMGFKTYMDSQGKYITQHEADMRVEDMRIMRQDLIARINRDKQIEEDRKAVLLKASKDRYAKVKTSH